jgi:hypothetical protein
MSQNQLSSALPIPFRSTIPQALLDQPLPQRTGCTRMIRHSNVLTTSLSSAVTAHSRFMLASIMRQILDGVPLAARTSAAVQYRTYCVHRDRELVSPRGRPTLHHLFIIFIGDCSTGTVLLCLEESWLLAHANPRLNIVHVLLVARRMAMRSNPALRGPSIASCPLAVSGPY